MTGTLTRKIDPHQKCRKSAPPATGPGAIASPDTPAQTPIAMARSWRSRKTWGTVARVDG